MPDFFRGKRVLITGGAGFIGSSIAHALVPRGARVTILDAMLPLYGGNLFNLEGIREEVAFVEGDIRDKALIDRLVADADIIFDLAAQVSHPDAKDMPLEDLDINLRGHLNVLEAMRAYAPSATVLFSSSWMVYGPITESPATEGHPARPASLYGIHKRVVEQYLQYYAEAFGLRTIVLRLPNPYGPRQQMKHAKYSVPGWFMRQAMEGKEITVYGDGLYERDYLYIDDVVGAFLALAESGEAGEAYHIGHDEKTRFVDMVDAVVATVGRGDRTLVPWPVGYVKNDTPAYILDTSKIRSATGWQPRVPLAEGIRKMAEYYARHHDKYWQ